MSPITILSAGYLTVAVSLSFGLMLVNALRLHLHRLEKLVLAFIVGSAVLSNVVFLTAALGEARKSVFLLIGALSFVGCILSRRFAAPPLRENPLPMDWKLL